MKNVEECEISVKMEGYLEKRAKPTFCKWWRKYWFVLQGRNLLCYKSKEAAEARRGSANLFLYFGNVQVVRPTHSSHNDKWPFEIIAKHTVVQLAASDSETRRKWLDALQSALQLPMVSSPMKRKGSASITKLFPLKDFALRKEISISHPNLRTVSDEEHIYECPPFVMNRKFFGELSRPIQPNLPEFSDLVASSPHIYEVVSCRETARPLPVIVTEAETEEPAVLLRRKPPADVKRLAVPSGMCSRRSTTTEFFLGDKNSDWPGLSLDLYDEVLDEIMQNRKESGRDSPVNSAVDDKDTQTDFPEVDFAQMPRFNDAKEELISYLSTSSLAKSELSFGEESSDSKAKRGTYVVSTNQKDSDIQS